MGKSKIKGEHIGWQVRLILLVLLVGIFQFPANANAGIFDCMKAQKWANAKSLRNSYLKAPVSKSDADWIDSYIFARIFTGYPKCFNNKDVAVMNQYVSFINNYCVRYPTWSKVCFIAKGNGKLADWTYGNYK